jgi:Uma2 family endonuclease
VTEAIAVLGFEEFCELEQRGDSRHELVGGRVYVMAGGSERHDLAAGLLYELLAPAARGAGCRPFTANRLVRTASGAGYYPDVLIVCGPAAHRLYETRPAVVIEVLSPSTVGIDRREKPLAYATAGTLTHYVLVDPDQRRIEVATPTLAGLDWRAYGPDEAVPLPWATLDVTAFYDILDVTATTR